MLNLGLLDKAKGGGEGPLHWKIPPEPPCFDGNPPFAIGKYRKMI
jgi:hypothetical protein